MCNQDTDSALINNFGRDDIRLRQSHDVNQSEWTTQDSEAPHVRVIQFMKMSCPLMVKHCKMSRCLLIPENKCRY